MKKSALIVTLLVITLVVGLVLYFKRASKNTDTTDNTLPDLPLNTLDLALRPFIYLAPDATGRSLAITLSGAPSSGEMEYEMIYNAAGKQEGALGSIFLGSEKQPITKSILLGSKSGGGKITYHEGVTGGSLTVTYDETRLKESWSYLTFDTADPVISSVDAKLSVTIPAKTLKKGDRIVVMKTFGYPKTGLPEGAKVIAGPYGYFAVSPVKLPTSVSLVLPAGEHINPTIYEYAGVSWKKVTTTLKGDTVSGSATGNIFLVTAE